MKISNEHKKHFYEKISRKRQKRNENNETQRRSDGKRWHKKHYNSEWFSNEQRE